eukprot:886908-Amorphochlora_amoeboformis.AAC.1
MSVYLVVHTSVLQVYCECIDECICEGIVEFISRVSESVCNLSGMEVPADDTMREGVSYRHALSVLSERGTVILSMLYQTRAGRGRRKRLGYEYHSTWPPEEAIGKQRNTWDMNMRNKSQRVAAGMDTFRLDSSSFRFPTEREQTMSGSQRPNTGFQHINTHKPNGTGPDDVKM